MRDPANILFTPARWLRGDGLDRARIERLWDSSRERDPRGHTAHVICGAVSCFLITMPTSIAELSLVPVFVMLVLRSWVVWRQARAFLGNPVPVLAVLFTIWLWIGLAWTDAPVRTALEEPGNMRWCLAVFFLWPVLDARRVLIAALVAGLMVGQFYQLAQGIAGVVGFEALASQRLPGRLSGWWDPAVAGGVLTVALGLHLPAALMGSGRARWFAILMVAACVASLVATGSRGGWIAAAGLIALGGGFAAVRGGGRRVILVAVAAGVIGTVFAAAAPPVRQRATEAYTEVRDAFVSGDTSTATGARIAMTAWATRAWLSRPIFGVGTGGYAEWARSEIERRNEGLPESERLEIPPLHDHAHNTWAHVAACNGLVGVALLAGVFAAGLCNAVRCVRGRWGSYAAGPAFALLGLVFFSAFDTVHASGQSAALMGALLALSPAWLPPDRAGEDGSDADA
jgi:O-antigen ligase